MPVNFKLGCFVTIISGGVFRRVYSLVLIGVFFVFVNIFKYSPSLDYLFASYAVIIFHFIFIFICLFNKILISEIKLKGFFSYCRDLNSDFFKEVQDFWISSFLLIFFYVFYLFTFLIYALVKVQLLNRENCENNLIDSTFYSLLSSFLIFAAVSIIWKIFCEY